MMATLLIRGGRVIDPSQSQDGKADILIEQGKIADIQPSIPVNGAKTIDAAGHLIVPGFVDLHTHLRQPGREDQETIATGSAAAARGGFTTICAMPNTDPAMDHRGVVELVQQEAQRVGIVTVHPIGAITCGRQGKTLTDFGELFDAGCVALSDDGRPVADSLLMRRALEYATVFDRPIIQHAEDPALAAGGVMHEGQVSATLGLRGMPVQAESLMVQRDIALSELTGGWVHFAHLSTAVSVELIRQAKRRGVRVTCEVTPHHLALTDARVGEFDAIAKVNPPLRTEDDRQALLEGLRDGTIDCIATDHAPHADWEKSADFDAAPFGITGLETALGVCAATLVQPGLLTWPQLVERMARTPARIAGLETGTLAIGAPADLTVINPEARWTVEPKQFASMSHCSPFAGDTLPAQVVRTLRHGIEVYAA